MSYWSDEDDLYFEDFAEDSPGDQTFQASSILGISLGISFSRVVDQGVLYPDLDFEKKPGSRHVLRKKWIRNRSLKKQPGSGSYLILAQYKSI